MNKICPNLKNKEVAKEFNELLEATSENAAYHIWSENNGNAIDKAPNGEPSKLFTDLLSHFNGDRVSAIRAKAKTFSNSFKTVYPRESYEDATIEDLFNGLDETKLKLFPNGIGVYSAKSVLKRAIDNNMIGKTYLPLANKLLSATDLGHVHLVTEFEDYDTGGNYDGFGNVTLSLNDTIWTHKDDPKWIGSILLHELVHRYTLTSMRDNAEFAKEMNDSFKSYKAINDNNDGIYGFTDAKEFVAELMSNPTFYREVKSRFLKLLDEFVKKILTSLGLSTSVKSAESLRDIIGLEIDKNLNKTNRELYVDHTSFKKMDQQSAIDSTKLTNILRMDEMYKKLLSSLTLRVKDIKNAANLDVKELQNVELQLQLLNNLEVGQALIQYIPLMQNDISSVIETINGFNDAMLQAQYKGETVEIPATSLLDIKRGFLGFYSDVITSMQDVLEDPASFEYLTSKGISMKDMQLYKDDLRRIESDYNNINRKYGNLVTYQATNNIIAYAKEHGSTTTEILRKNILFADKDVPFYERYAYSPIHSNDEMLGQLANRLVGVKNITERDVLKKGKALVKLADGLSQKDIQTLYEKTKDGKKTAYLVRPLNYGEFQMNKVAKQTALANEYGLPNIYERPQDRKQLAEYNKKLNDWYDKHAERRYTKEYYNLFNNLSSESALARETLQIELRMIYQNVTDTKGNVHLEDLTEDQWMRILSLNKQKRDLANPFNLDGTAKVGVDKDIAEELTTLNNTLRDNLKYKVDLPKFKEAYLTAKRTMSHDKLLTWIKRNTVRVVKQEFYDALARLAEPRSEEYTKLKTERANLQKLYKTEDGTIDADFMPNAVKEKIIDISERMSAMMDKESSSNPEKAKLFNSIATIIVSDGYGVAWEQAANRGDEHLSNWLRYNTVEVRYKDGTTGIKPASFWTQLVPVDEKMYTYKPSSQWHALEESSNFINPNFDQTSKEFAIPKKSVYDNSTAYNKVRSNTSLSKLYDGVFGMLNDSNNMLDFLYNIDNYKLPQIEANAFEIVGKADSIGKGISTSLSNALTVRDTDTEYEGASPAIRSDGTYVKLIPTRYIKALDDPNTITDDIVGAAIAYYSMALNHKNMRKVEPDLNLLLDQMGKRTTAGGELGTEMNVYKRATELMDMHLYGKRRQRGKNDEFTLFGKKMSKSKLAFGFASFLRLSTLSHNMNVILTGLITNKVNTRIESLTGEYFDSHTLLMAAKEVALSYPSMIASVGKIKTTNKLSSMMEYNQVVFNNAEMFHNLHKSRVARTLQKHFWYGGHTMVDYSTKGRLTAAVYFNYKLFNDKFMNFSEFRTNNKDLDKKALKDKWNKLTTTLYDAYEVMDEQVTIKPAYANKITSILEDKVKNTINMIGSRIDGQLSDIDRASIHTNCYAAFLVMFRNFIIQMMQTRFKSAHFNYSKGNWDEGYYAAVKNYTSRHVFNKEKLAQLKEVCDNFDELDEMERTAVRRVASEVIINLVLFTVIAQLLAAWSDDDKKDWGKAEIAYLATRTRLELSTPYNALDLLNMFQNPTAAVPYLNTFVGFGELMLNPDDEVKSGPYKGHTKLFKGLMKLTPGKMYYEALDPNSKRRYLENQIMKSDPFTTISNFVTKPFKEQQ